MDLQMPFVHANYRRVMGAPVLESPETLKLSLGPLGASLRAVGAGWGLLGSWGEEGSPLEGGSY